MKLWRWILDWLCWFWLLITTPPDHPEQPDPDMNKKLKSFLQFTWLSWFASMKVEALILVLGLVLFFKALPWLREFDPTAAGLDGGTLTFPIVGVVAVIAAVILFFIIVRAVVPFIDNWFDGEAVDKPRAGLMEDWFRASPGLRIGVFFGLMGCVILGVCLVTAAAF